MLKNLLKSFPFLFLFALSSFVYGNIRLMNVVQLGNILNIFSKCDVNLHSYDGISFEIITAAPLSIHSNKPSQMEPDDQIGTNIRLECIAVFHLVTKNSGRTLKFFEISEQKRQRRLS